MRILDLYDVSFEGKGIFSQDRCLWIINDGGHKSTINIPDHEQIMDLFRWLSDNNCLRHLHELVPTVTTNAREIAEAINRASAIDEHRYLATPIYRSPSNPYLPVGFGYEIPETKWKVSWSFTSREHAVMFKLAKGGVSFA